MWWATFLLNASNHGQPSWLLDYYHLCGPLSTALESVTSRIGMTVITETFFLPCCWYCQCWLETYKLAGTLSIIILCVLLNFSMLSVTSGVKIYKTTFSNLGIFCCYRQIHKHQAMYLRSWINVLSTLAVRYLRKCVPAFQAGKKLRWIPPGETSQHGKV